jgi:kynurenine formamidase
MKIDLSCKVDKKVLEAVGLGAQALATDLDKAGHVGTHFDARDKEFSIEKIITRGIVFDIRHIKTGEVTINDIDLNNVQPNDFIMFYSGVLNKFGYGTKEYFTTYVELSDELVDGLIAKNVSFIGVDMGGAKGPENHVRIDQYCADRGVFIIENLNNLDLHYEATKGKPFTTYTFPVNMSGFSGLPRRIIAEV